MRFPLRAWFGLRLGVRTRGLLPPLSSFAYHTTSCEKLLHHRLHRIPCWCLLALLPVFEKALDCDNRRICLQNCCTELTCLRITSLGRITSWCSTPPPTFHWDWRRSSLHAQWFQQDGARPHTTPEVLEFLHSKFQCRILSIRVAQQFQCGFSFPSSIPDLNPCDSFIWGGLKDKVFSVPRTLPELKERFKESCAQVTRRMVTRVVQNFVLCLQVVRESPGGSHRARHPQLYPYLNFWSLFVTLTLFSNKIHSLSPRYW